jgi:hypothetical protein
MTLADSIQSQINKDIEKLETQYQEELKEIKNTWVQVLTETKKLHAEKIDEAVATQVNFHKFQQSKANKFQYGYSLQTQLDSIYKEIIPEILNSKFVQHLIKKTLQNVDKSIKFTITGEYSDQLEQAIQKLGYTFETIKDTNNLGVVKAKLKSGHLEITLEDILNTVKQKTLPVVIKEI